MTKAVNKATWVQRNISPLMTWGFSWGCQSRKAVAWGIRTLSVRLNDREKTSLRLFLKKHKILLPKYSLVELKELQHYHVRKIMTTTKLTLAADDFLVNTGREDLQKIIPKIVDKKVSGRIYFRPPPVDYGKVFSRVKPRILNEIKRETKSEESWHSKVIQHAFDLARHVSRLDEAELIYRMQKTAEIGGDIQALIASLFMELSVEKTYKFLSSSHSEGLRGLAHSICAIIEKYQHIKIDFDFSLSQIAKDKKYICRKMRELIQETEYSQTLLLLFMRKLTEARMEKSRSLRVLNEIRFFYAPLAERLGLVFLADDFRDQYLRIGNPDKYRFVMEKVRKRIGMNYDSAKIFLRIYALALESYLLDKLGADFQGITIKFRVKSPYSIWNKVEVRGEYKYEEVGDILGIKIICDSEDKKVLLRLRDILRKSDLFVVKADDIKEELEEQEVPQQKDEKLKKVKWVGIKMAGKNESDIPVEIQLMTQEMNIENNRGKAATWIYNLKKELEKQKVVQIFDRLELKHVMSSDYDKNFTQLRNFWTKDIKITA